MNATKDHYKNFEELYGQLPSEVDRPSLSSTSVSSEAKAVDKQNKKLLVAAKVRATIGCIECKKLRCIYSAGALTIEEKKFLKQVIEDRAYSCGCELFPPDSPFHSTIICRQALSCNDTMESQYYSSSCVSFPSVCWFCAGPEEMLVEDEYMQNLRSEYAVVRPICFLCRSDGKRPATWGASNVSKKSKH